MEALKREAEDEMEVEEDELLKSDPLFVWRSMRLIVRDRPDLLELAGHSVAGGFDAIKKSTQTTPSHS